MNHISRINTITLLIFTIFALVLPSLADNPCPEHSTMGDTGDCVPDNGYYFDGKGDVVLCEAGYYCKGGERSPCAPGTFNYMAGSTACEPCYIGFAAPSKASEFCTMCAAGQYPTRDDVYVSSGATKCSVCPAGHMCPTGRNQPVGCSGEFWAEVGYFSCYVCEAGSHLTVSNNSIDNNPVNVNCMPCLPGHYSESNGAASCLKCPKNSVQELANQTSCTLCTDGYYAMGASNTAVDEAGVRCASCPRGYACHEDSPGAGSSRHACLTTDYEYQPSQGQTTCLTCSSDADRPYLYISTSERCDYCDETTYLVNQSGLDPKCMSCAFSATLPNYCERRTDPHGVSYHVVAICGARSRRRDDYSCELCPLDYVCNGTEVYEWRYRPSINFARAPKSSTITLATLIVVSGAGLWIGLGVRRCVLKGRNKPKYEAVATPPSSTTEDELSGIEAWV